MQKIFDTSTLQGLKAAERYKTRLNNTCESVNVYAIGLNRVQIVGLQHNPSNQGQAPQFQTTNQLTEK